jgi:hypothetical protein
MASHFAQRARHGTGLVLLLMLTACSTASDQAGAPGEPLHFALRCNAANTWDACTRQATQLCPSGYKTISQTENADAKVLRITCSRAVFRPTRLPDR